MKIKVLLVAALAFLMSNLAFTENENIAMEYVSVDINDKESLQRGAKMFMNYCSGCHSSNTCVITVHFRILD